MTKSELHSALSLLLFTIGNYPPRIQKKLINPLKEGFSIDFEKVPAEIYEEAGIDREKILKAINREALI